MIEDESINRLLSVSSIVCFPSKDIKNSPGNREELYLKNARLHFSQLHMRVRLTPSKRGLVAPLLLARKCLTHVRDLLFVNKHQT